MHLPPYIFTCDCSFITNIMYQPLISLYVHVIQKRYLYTVCSMNFLSVINEKMASIEYEEKKHCKSKIWVMENLSKKYCNFKFLNKWSILKIHQKRFFFILLRKSNSLTCISYRIFWYCQLWLLLATFQYHYGNMNVE